MKIFQIFPYKLIWKNLEYFHAICNKETSFYCILYMAQNNQIVRLKFWGMWCDLLLLSLPGPLRPRLLAPDRVLSMDQIELNCVITLN